MTETALSTRNGTTSQDVATYTDVGDDGIDAGDRDPRRCVRRCWELRFESLRSRDGLRFVADVMCRNSAGERVVPFMTGASVVRRWEGVEGVRRERDCWLEGS